MPELRDRIIACLGKFPGRVPLEPRILSVESQEGYSRQLVEYQVEVGEWAPAYLLVPYDVCDPAPAILAIHQHAGEFYLGKSEPAGLSKNSMYHYGLELCRRGYVVLCPDLLCFEERRPPEFRRVETPSLDGASYEKLMACKLFLEGSSLQTKYLWDLARAVDYLQTLDVVDPERIGCIGHSLGGQEATWLTWFESRIRVGVSSCGHSTYRTILRDGIGHNFASYVFGLLQVCDMDALVADISPKPYLMTNGTEDWIFPLDGVREIAQVAGRAYAEAGVPDCFQSLIFEGGHGFPVVMREAAYEWFDRWL